MTVEAIRPPSDDEVANDAIVLPEASNPNAVSHAMLRSVIDTSIAAIGEIARTPPRSHGLGSTDDASNDDSSTDPSSAPTDDPSYDPTAANDPANNTPDNITMGWLSNFSDLPFSDIYDFPGNDLMSAYLRFLYDMKAFPGSLNLMTIFCDNFAALSRSGKLNNPDFLKALTAGEGIASVLKEIVFVKALASYRLTGKLPDANFFTQLAAQFSGSDPVSVQLRGYIASIQNGGLDAQLLASKKSANQEWGDFITSDAIGDLRTSVLMTLVQRFVDAFKNGDWNAIYRLILFLMMMKESDYDDQVSGFGQTTNWAAELEKEVKQMMSDFQDMKSTNPTNPTAAADFFKHFEHIKDVIDGSYLGEKLKDTLSGDFTQIANLDSPEKGTTAEQYYKNMMASDPTNSTHWQEHFTKQMQSLFASNSTSPGGGVAGDTQNSLTSLSTGLTDMGQTLAAQISQTTNLSKTQTGTAKTMLDRFESSETTAVKNQLS